MWAAAAFTLLLIAISVVAFATYKDISEDAAGDSSAPWLPADPDKAGDVIVVGDAINVGALSLTAVIGLLVGGLGGFLTSLIRSRVGRSKRQPGQKKRVWRYREMTRREKRRLGVVLIVSSSLASAPFAVFGLTGDRGGAADTFVLIFSVGGTLGTLTGLVTALVQVRPSRTVMQIVEDRLKSEREQMARDLEGMRESDARQMEQWKNEASATLYAEIMSQVERGLITCSKCAELGEAHYAAPEEEPQVPAARDAEDASKPCECGGPSSVSLLYFPPRFQSKRTAS